MGATWTARLVVLLASLGILAAGLTSPPSAAAQDIQVTSADPPAAEQGTINLDVVIKGKGFKNGAQAKWFVTGTTNPGGVTVNSTTFISPTELRANITVADDATISTYDIQVTNSNGRSGKGTELFSVVAKGTGPCTSDISLRVILAPGFVNGGTARLYGDSDFGTTAKTYNNPADPLFHGGSIYTDGVEGVYAEIQGCNGTNDFTVRVTTGSKRFFNFDFSEQLTAPDPRAVNVTGKTYREGFVHAYQVANDALYVSGQLNTCFGSTLGTIIKGQAAHVLLRNPAVLETAPSGVPSCPDGSNTTLANQGGDTSILRVTHPDACTWIIIPVADSMGWYRAGLIEQLRGGTYVSGGQYNMPFAMKVIKLGCSAEASQ
jgi:hypothetical protein